MKQMCGYNKGVPRWEHPLFGGERTGFHDETGSEPAVQHPPIHSARLRAVGEARGKVLLRPDRPGTAQPHHDPLRRGFYQPGGGTLSVRGQRTDADVADPAGAAVGGYPRAADSAGSAGLSALHTDQKPQI